VAADGAAGDRFGTSVALDGEMALVGANRANVSGNTNQGATYVFTRSGANWSQQQKLVATDGAADDQFGRSVALDGETALVGAWAANIGGNINQGAAYVFTRSGANWSQQQKLVAADGAASDLFGISVALDGETALVGAYMANVGGNSSQGTAYVFTRSGANWSQQQKLVAADGAAGDQFGVSVALDGQTALVGAHLANMGGNTEQGAAYVFTQSGTDWSQQQKLVAADGAAGDLFGISVALDGETVLVGAILANVGGNTEQGAAYVFTRSGANWSQQQKLVAADGAAGDRFGYSVALDGETALIGAYEANVGGSTAAGKFYTTTRGPVPWPVTGSNVAATAPPLTISAFPWPWTGRRRWSARTGPMSAATPIRGPPMSSRAMVPFGYSSRSWWPPTALPWTNSAFPWPWTGKRRWSARTRPTWATIPTRGPPTSSRAAARAGARSRSCWPPTALPLTGSAVP
jgi:hypothetical protein